MFIVHFFSCALSCSGNKCLNAASRNIYHTYEYNNCLFSSFGVSYKMDKSKWVDSAVREDLDIFFQR